MPRRNGAVAASLGVRVRFVATSWTALVVFDLAAGAFDIGGGVAA